MKNFYNYIFYRFYNYYTPEKNKEDRAIAATFFLTMFESFNIVSIIFLIQQYFKGEFFNKIHSIIIFVIFALLNYFLFLRKKRFKQILAYYNEELNEDAGKIKIKSRWVLLYIILTMLVLSFGVLLDSVKGDLKLVENYLRNLFGL